jgi:hypothetical protein
VIWSSHQSHCRTPRRHLPAPHGQVAIDRVQLHPEASPPSAFCSYDLRAGAAERLLGQVAGFRERGQHCFDQRQLIGVVALGVAGVGFEAGKGLMLNLPRQVWRVHAASLLAFRSEKVSPVSASTALVSVNCCQRSTATST